MGVPAAEKQLNLLMIEKSFLLQGFVSLVRDKCFVKASEKAYRTATRKALIRTGVVPVCRPNDRDLYPISEMEDELLADPIFIEPPVCGGILGKAKPVVVGNFTSIVSHNSTVPHSSSLWKSLFLWTTDYILWTL